MNTERIYKVGEGRPNVVDGIKNGEINLVINTPLGAQSRFDEEAIGKACIKKGILAITTLSGANAAVDAVSHKDDYSVKSIQDYHQFSFPLVDRSDDLKVMEELSIFNLENVPILQDNASPSNYFDSWLF